MDGQQRKHGNDNLTKNLERPARGRLRRTRDSGALPDATPSRKNRFDEASRRHTDRRRLP
jgi:hypothetical protein